MFGNGNTYIVDSLIVAALTVFNRGHTNVSEWAPKEGSLALAVYTNHTPFIV